MSEPFWPIYFDESGNTGQNLTDPEQPIFTLASCSISDQEAEDIFSAIESSSHELHFKSLKRRSSGHNIIIHILTHKAITPQTVKVSVIHKNFMIVSKIVDYLIEYMYFRNGRDLYQNGHNIILSNILYSMLYQFTKTSSFHHMLKSFVIMVKSKRPESIESFYHSVDLMLTNTRSITTIHYLNMIKATRPYCFGALENLAQDNLDPAVTALFAHLEQWGHSYPACFQPIHDDSNTISRNEKPLKQFMLRPNLTSISSEHGYDRRKILLPFRCSHIQFKNSATSKQIQIADIISSSINYWATCIQSNYAKKNDDLFNKLNSLDLDQYVGHNKVWPTNESTPEELGTKYDGTGGCAADSIAAFLISNS